jgi:hypothetical protein
VSEAVSLAAPGSLVELERRDREEYADETDGATGTTGMTEEHGTHHKQSMPYSQTRTSDVITSDVKSSVKRKSGDGSASSHIQWQLLVGSEDTALQGSLERLAVLSRGWRDIKGGSDGHGDIDWLERARRAMGTGETGGRRAVLERFCDGLNSNSGCYGGRGFEDRDGDGDANAQNADRKVRVEVVQGAGHVLAELAPSMVRFFEGVLRDMYGRGG